MQPPALAIFRRYVTEFVNRHDFSVLPRIMQPDYTLHTSGLRIQGRDGPYRNAVARQMEQFPGLQFTLHRLFVTGDAVGVHFTEHGASRLHGGARAAWPSIAIYESRDGLLAQCMIEQDYYSRRRQLASRAPVAVAAPAIAPWDETDAETDPAAEAAVTAWLQAGRWLESRDIDIDDSGAMGAIEAVLDHGDVALTRMISGRTRSGESHVVFHALQSGPVSPAFAAAAGGRAGEAASLHLSGFVTLRDGRVAEGNIIRDRWGLFRRLANSNDRHGA
nr:nuclear transport factor 2 family protein [Sphingomonas colocasiae]